MRRLLPLSLVLLPLGALAGPGSLEQPVRPTAQSLSLLVDPSEATYTGQTTIALAIDDKVERFQLHAEDLSIFDGSISNGRRTWQVDVAPAKGGLVTVVPPRKLRPGTYTLELSFENDFHTEQPYGVYKFEAGGHPFLATQFQADDARTAFPCFDMPAYKIPWRIAVEAPDTLQIIGNTPVASESTDGGWRKVTFAETKPTPSYLLALAVGPYVGVPLEGMSVPGYVWTVPGMETMTGFARREIPRSLETLEGWFGTDYPYAKLDWIVVPEFPYGAMENPGAVVSRPELALVDPDGGTPDQQMQIAHTIAHELAHMWFGDLVTLQWWDDFWLNESFADAVAAWVVERNWPEHGPGPRYVEKVHSSLAAEGYATTRPLRTEVDPAHVFESINMMVYGKGLGVLRTIEQWLGPETYQQGVRAYLAEHAWGNATAEDLFAALSEASGEDVAGVLAAYLDEPGAPLVRFETSGDGTVTLSQARYAVHGAEIESSPTWKVPMVAKYATADGVHQAPLLLVEAEQQLKLADTAVEWVFPTAGGTGYLVWAQSDADLATLFDAAGEHLDPVERVALLSNLARLRNAGIVKGGEQFGLLARLEGETDPVVIDRMVDMLSLLEDTAGDDQSEIVARYVRDTVGPALDRIGMQPKQGEPPTVTDLRPKLLHWMGDLGDDPEVLAFAEETTRRFIEDPSSVPPSIAAVCVDLHAAQAGEGFQQAMLQGYRDTADPALKQVFLSGFAKVPSDEAEQRALEFALSDEPRFGHAFMVIGAVFDEENEQDEALAWAMEHYRPLADTLPPPFRAYLAGFGGGCSVERYERAEAFFGDPERAVPGIERVLREVGESVHTCVAARELHGPSVQAFLDEYASDAAEADE